MALPRPVSKKVDDVFRKLHKPGRKAVTLEAMDDAVRQRMNFIGTEKAPAPRRTPGSGAGQLLHMADDFDALLEDFKE